MGLGICTQILWIIYATGDFKYRFQITISASCWLVCWIMLLCKRPPMQSAAYMQVPTNDVQVPEAAQTQQAPVPLATAQNIRLPQSPGFARQKR